jgi:hypothetical protein
MAAASPSTATEARRREGEDTMAMGPVQLLALGCRRPEVQGELGQALDRLGDNDLVRVFDAPAVGNHADTTLQARHQTRLSADHHQQAAFGALVGGLIGRGGAGQDGLELGAEAVAERGGVVREEAAWAVRGELPADSAGLLEHGWATPLGDAVARRVEVGWGRRSSAPLTWSPSGWSRPRPPPWPGSMRHDLCSAPNQQGGTSMLGPSRRVARRPARGTVGGPAAAAGVASSGRRVGRRSARRVARRRV